jgi:hypothetical protein
LLLVLEKDVRKPVFEEALLSVLCQKSVREKDSREGQYFGTFPHYSTS